MDVVIEILKWTVVIFVAGFVGQFGKSLTLWMLARAREKKAAREKETRAGAGPRKAVAESIPVEKAPSLPAPPDGEPGSGEQEKIDKKAAKAEKKRLKKEAKAEEKRAKEEAKAGAEPPDEETDATERDIVDEAFEAVDSAYEERPPHVPRRESPQRSDEPDEPESMLE